MRDYVPFVLSTIQSTFAIRLNKPANTINHVKHCCEYNMEIIALGLGLEPILALSFALCYISLLTTPSCFFHIALMAVLQLIII